VLQVVEKEQQLALSDVLREAILGAHDLCDGLGDERRVTQGSEPHPENARRVLGDERRGSFQREPGLARAAGTREGKEPCSLPDPREHLLELCLPAHERARRTRQIRIRDRLQRRETSVPELEDRNRFAHVLQAVLAEVDELVLDKRGGRRGEDDLTAVRGGGDTCGEVDVVTDVALVGEKRRARV
jgi:hypothetical protein